MSDPPPTPPRPGHRRRVAEELALLLARPEVRRAVRLLQMLGIEPASDLEAGSPRRASAGKVASTPRPISIWCPEDRAGELVFVRPPPSPLGDHFAARREIPARKAEGCPRVAFCGESVAAGYFYAPHRTPAMVLEHFLGRALCGAADVVDLARTNETLAGLGATVAAAMQLDPGVLVVFAGNNPPLLETPEVSPYTPSVSGRQHLAAAFGRGGAAGLAALGAGRLAAAVEEAGSAIAAATAGVPVVVVLPEVNLADWRLRQPVHWLPGDGVARWHELAEKAEAALAIERWEVALAAADAMLALDAGHCPTSHTIKGQALLGLGRVELAEAALRSAVDAQNLATLCQLGAPQVNRRLAAQLRALAARHGWRVVDLPAVFAEHLAAVGEVPMPGRRLFADYCHLTAEGTDVAMAAVAAALLEVLGAPARASWRELLACHAPPPPPPALAATASFGAAVHTAHRWPGEKGEILRHWLAAAFAASTDAAEALARAFVVARAAPVPAVFSSAQQDMLELEFPLGPQHGWTWDGLDPDVLTALDEVLRERDPALAASLRDLLVAGSAAERAPFDLLAERHLRDPVARFYPEAMPLDDLSGRAIFRAVSPRSWFTLVADGVAGLELVATARLPAIAGAEGARRGALALELQGAARRTPLASWTVAESWTRHEVHVPAGELPRGLVHLALSWPAPPAVGDAAQAAISRRLEEGLDADLHPVFGELARFTARWLDKKP